MDAIMVKEILEEIKKITIECDSSFDSNEMDEFDALEHFQRYHEKIMSLLGIVSTHEI